MNLRKGCSHYRKQRDHFILTFDAPHVREGD